MFVRMQVRQDVDIRSAVSQGLLKDWSCLCQRPDVERESPLRT
jgi:hypothetical protein